MDYRSKTIVGLNFIVLFSSYLTAQNPIHHTSYQDSTRLSPMSASLQSILRRGHFEGKVRTYGMATTNMGHLADYYAIAAGGGIHYESPLIAKHLSFEIGGMFIYNLTSSDLGQPDTSTQVKDRYEIALFDLENPDNRNDLDRMDEFNLRFHFGQKIKSRLTLGRQVINTPLINPQDGRMRPSLMSGLWLNMTHTKWTIQGGWLWAAAPRSTVRWFSIGNSIGVYSNGTTTTGNKGNYFEHTTSKGVFVAGIKSGLSRHLTLSAWNYLIDNVSNTAFLQTDWEYPLSMSDWKWKIAAQIIRQDAVGSGGNADASKAYMTKGSKSWIFGGRVGLTSIKSQMLLNFTHITTDGRFTFPREWGRDPLFTFMQRERNEGAGGVTAISMNLSHDMLKRVLQTQVGLGYYKMPDVKDFKLNKYGLPSYLQLNVSGKYRFSGFWQNLTTEMLIVHKWNRGKLYDDNRYRINKVDMTNYNFVMNYIF